MVGRQGSDWEGNNRMSEINVVAHIHARPGNHELVGSELEKMIAPTRAEPGCKQYDLMTDINDPCHFVFFETWDSSESHQKHMDSSHVAAFVVACKGRIGGSSIYHLDKRG